MEEMGRCLKEKELNEEQWSKDGAVWKRVEEKTNKSVIQVKIR